MRCSLRGVTGITGEWNERHDLVTSPVAIKCGLTVVNGDNCHQLFSAASSRLFTRANSQKLFCMFRITRRKMQCLWELLRTSNEMLSQLSLKSSLSFSPHNSQWWSHWRRPNAWLNCYKYPAPRQQNICSQAFLSDSGWKNTGRDSSPRLLSGIDWPPNHAMKWVDLLHRNSLTFLNNQVFE
jgi:hypothetical protein